LSDLGGLWCQYFSAKLTPYDRLVWSTASNCTVVKMCNLTVLRFFDVYSLANQRAIHIFRMI